MPVNNYLKDCKYSLNNLDNYIYLYTFDEPILNFITDDGENNATATSIKGSSQRLYCNSVQYQSTTSIDNRFAFDNTLTVTLSEHSKVSHYSIIQTLLNGNWMVVFKNTYGDAFVVNAEYPVMVSYSYVINDEKTPNNLTITFRALQNVPTVNLKGSVAFSSTLCDNYCEYNISRIESLKMIDMNKATIDVDDDGFTLTENGEGNLKTIEFNPTSMSFTDSFDGREFSQTLTFQIPFESYRYYFHYNLLEFLDNRYYALIKTTDENNILGGFRQGLFPSYTISTADNNNVITITLNAKYTNYSVLGSDTMSTTTNDSMFYKPVIGECVDNLYVWTLIEQYNTNGVATNGYYCLNGFEDIYKDYTILGTYDKYDTRFGLKLIDYNIVCSEGCKINNLPSSIQFKTSGETQCFTLDTTCSIIWEWNSTAIGLTFDEITKELCVTSKVDEGTFSIKATTTDDTIQYATVVIGDGGVTGDTTTTINITAEGQKVTVIPTKGMNNVKSLTSSLQYQINQNGNGYEVTVPENINEYERLFNVNVTYNDGTIETITIKQGQMYYKLISTQETQCDGNNLYYINQKYKGYTSDVINIFVENVNGEMKESNSELCMNYEEKESGCTSCFEGYVYTLYEYKKDGNVIATKYEKTNETCSNNGTTEFRINTGKAVCENGIAFYVEEMYGLNCSDNTTMVLLSPTIEQTSTTQATDSNVCETINPEVSGDTLYRWVDTDDTYCLPSGSSINCITSSITNTYCNGKNLYGDITFYLDVLCDETIKQVTSKRINTLISYNSTECGGSGSSSAYGDLIYVFKNNRSFYDLNGQYYTATTNNSLDNGDGTYTAYVNLEELGLSTLTRMNFSGRLAEDDFLKYSGGSIISFIKFPDTTHITSMRWMFGDMFNIKNLDLTSFNTSNVTDMSYMFAYSYELTNINVSSFDTSNVTTMSNMFAGQPRMGIVDNNGNTSYLFRDKLTTLILSNFDTSKVTDMSYMFNGRTSLNYLNISNFDTSKVTDMRCMFHDCYSMTTFNVSNFDTSNVTNMTQMFGNCDNLTSIDLSNFNTSNLEKADNMFNDCYSLTTVNVSGWDVSKLMENNTSYMFYNCHSLSRLILGEVTAAEYNFWYRQVENKNALEYTLISNAGGGSGSNE